jgi:putative endonuclease
VDQIGDRSVMTDRPFPSSWPGLSRPSNWRTERVTGGWVYIMTNRINGTLYVGVTSNLARRIWEHREGLVEGFTKRYGLKRVVYVEHYDTILSTIQREHNIKHWPRHWKLRLISAQNPEWADLYDQVI